MVLIVHTITPRGNCSVALYQLAIMGWRMACPALTPYTLRHVCMYVCDDVCHATCQWSVVSGQWSEGHSLVSGGQSPPGRLLATGV